MVEDDAHPPPPPAPTSVPVPSYDRDRSRSDYGDPEITGELDSQATANQSQMQGCPLPPDMMPDATPAATGNLDDTLPEPDAISGNMPASNSCPAESAGPTLPMSDAPLPSSATGSNEVEEETIKKQIEEQNTHNHDMSWILSSNLRYFCRAL